MEYLSRSPIWSSGIMFSCGSTELFRRLVRRLVMAAPLANTTELKVLET